MSKRAWLEWIARAQGYAPTVDDTDDDLVWVIRNYRLRVSHKLLLPGCQSKTDPH